MIFRPATPSDGPGMLRLIESRPAGGDLRILYTRRPDAYQSYKMECAEAEMVLCTSDDGRLLAQAACLPRRLYINGEACTAGYVTGLHKAGGARADIRGMLDAGYARTRATRFFCSFLDSSRDAYGLFSRRGWARPVCGYTTYMLHPAAIRPVRHGFTFRRAAPGDSGRLLGFYNEFGPGYSYFPALESLGSFPESAAPDFFLLEDSGDIIAAGALWDQQAYKQYIVAGYGGAYRLAALFGPALRALRYPPLPKAGLPARFAYIS
ncbi:MAG: GNAT family N-acetyltransferase, partial [Clostridiales bacterium]|nr:GNAT family N-acetyltransferase [Clostridiales bacterium]